MNALSWRVRSSVVLVTSAVAFMVWCLVDTTALSMTAFFMVGLPLYLLGVLLYLWEIAVDLRMHRVL